VTADAWTHAYSRTEAAWPAGTDAGAKYWPPVARVDNVYGDRNLFCSCIPIADDPPAHASSAALV
jgi:glycine dehydrogenase